MRSLLLTLTIIFIATTELGLSPGQSALQASSFAICSLLNLGKGPNAQCGYQLNRKETSDLVKNLIKTSTQKQSNSSVSLYRVEKESGSYKLIKTSPSAGAIKYEDLHSVQ